MAADGTTFPPFQTIPDLAPARGLAFTDQVWINQNGIDRRCNLQDIANLTLPLTVTAFNGRTGPVQLTLLDVTNVGGAPIESPFFTGVPQGPTPPRGADDFRLATTAFVQDALLSSVVGVASFNGRTGEVTLQTSDITGAGGATAAQLANYLPLTGGVLTGPGNLIVNGVFNAAGGLAASNAIISGDLSIGATKAANTVWAGPASGPPAAPTWRQLSAADITGIPQGTVTSVGITGPADMIVTGSPITGAGTININRASQPSSTVLAAPSGVAGIPSYRALLQSDIVGGVGVTSVGLTAPSMFTVANSPITGSGSLALGLAPQPNNFVLAGPTAGGPLTPTFRQLTAADITGLPVGSVTSVGLAMPAEFTVANSPVTGAGTLTVTKASQAANLVYAAPNGAAGAPTFRALTQADISGGVGVTSVALSMPTMFNVSGGPITAAGTFNVTLAPVGNNLVFAGPTTGGPLAPTFRALTQADISGGVGVTSVGINMPADFNVANSPVTGSGNLIVTRASQAAGLVLASPAGAAGVPSYRALALTDLPAGVGTVTSVGLTAPAPFTVTGSPVTGSGSLALGVTPQNANLVWAGPTSGGAAAPTFRALTAADIPSLSGLYLPLAGGGVTGNLTVGGTLGVTGATTLAAVTNTGETVNGALTVNGNATFNSPSFLIDPTATDAGITLSKPASGNTNYIYGDTNGVKRWRIDLGDSTAEAGSNAGSNFDILRYDDTGALLSTPMTINRATGVTTFNNPVIFEGPGPTVVNIDSPTPGVRPLNFTTAGVLRWRIGANQTAEGGANAGSDFIINSYTDAGTIIGAALTITRSNMAAAFGGPLSAPSLSPTAATVPANGMYLPAANILGFAQNNVGRWFIASTNGLLHNSTNATLSMNKGVLVAGSVGLTQCLQAGYSADGTTGNGVAIYGNATNGGTSQITTNYVTTDGPLQIGTFTNQNALNIAVNGLVTAQDLAVRTAKPVGQALIGPPAGQAAAAPTWRQPNFLDIAGTIAPSQMMSPIDGNAESGTVNNVAKTAASTASATITSVSTPVHAGLAAFHLNKLAPTDDIQMMFKAVPVARGQTFNAQAWIQAGVAGPGVNVGILWGTAVDANGFLTGTTTSTLTANNVAVTTAYAFYGLSNVNVPAGGYTYAALFVESSGTNSGPLDLYVDDCAMAMTQPTSTIFIPQQTFTPTANMQTIGDGVFSGVSGSGWVELFGPLVMFRLTLQFTFTHTTASGAFSIGGFPFLTSAANSMYCGPFAVSPQPASPAQTMLAMPNNGVMCAWIYGNALVGNLWGPGAYGLASGTAYQVQAGGTYRAY